MKLSPEKVYEIVVFVSCIAAGIMHVTKSFIDVVLIQVVMKLLFCPVPESFNV
jgi:hypothetical protein